MIVDSGLKMLVKPIASGKSVVQKSIKLERKGAQCYKTFLRGNPEVLISETLEGY